MHFLRCNGRADPFRVIFYFNLHGCQIFALSQKMENPIFFETEPRLGTALGAFLNRAP